MPLCFLLFKSLYNFTGSFAMPTQHPFINTFTLEYNSSLLQDSISTINGLTYSYKDELFAEIVI